jgi:ABC-type lipoprotein export system ATPase subunit
MSVAAVEATGLYHIYRARDIETVALKGAELTLTAGSWTSVMGPSGSGKSTLVDILAGFLEPSAGSVVVGGEDLTRLPVRERSATRRRSIGLVRQRGNLHPLLNVAENVALSLVLDGRRGRDVSGPTSEVLEAVGLGDRGRQPVHTLSGGEAQRVAIAAAVVHRPVVLIADELTGELDEGTTALILDLLDELMAARGTSLLTVTHNPVVAERAGHQVVMRDGTLVDVG